MEKIELSIEDLEERIAPISFLFLDGVGSFYPTTSTIVTGAEGGSFMNLTFGSNSLQPILPTTYPLPLGLGVL